MAPLRLAALGSVLVVVLLAGGCSPAPGPDGPERVVLAVATGFGQGGRETTADIVNIGVPGLYNLTGQRIRVRKVTLASVPPAVHLLSVTAHPGQTVGLLRGDLVRLCRKSYPPYPVTDAVAAPHALSNWYLVLAITFTRPGRYYLGRVKIFYTAGGQRGWQYQNLFTTLTVTVARPGTKSFFDGCP